MQLTKADGKQQTTRLESYRSQVAEQSLAPRTFLRLQSTVSSFWWVVSNLFVPQFLKSWLRCESELAHFDFSHHTRQFIWSHRFSAILLLKRPRQLSSSAQISLEIQSQNQIHNYTAFQLPFTAKNTNVLPRLLQYRPRINHREHRWRFLPPPQYVSCCQSQ